MWGDNVYHQLLGVVLAAVMLAGTAFGGALVGVHLQPDDGPVPEDVDEDDRVIEYDRGTYQLTLASDNNSRIDYELVILGAAEASNDTDESTVDCAEEMCVLNGQVGDDERAEYNVSGTLLSVSPRDNLHVYIDGAFEGDAATGVGWGQNNDTKGNLIDDNDSDENNEGGSDSNDDSDSDDGDSDTRNGNGGSEDYTCDDFDTWEDAQEVYEGSDGAYGLDGDDDGTACEGLPGASDGDNPPPAEAFSFKYENCHTVTIDLDNGYDDAGDWEIGEINTTFYTNGGLDTLSIAPPEELPTTIDANEQVDGAVTDVKINNATLAINDSDNRQTVDESNPNDEECSELIDEQWEEYQNGSDLITDPGAVADALAVAAIVVGTDEPADEHIVLENTADNLIDLSDWEVRDRDDGGMVAAGTINPFEFPTEFTLGPGESVTIWTGDGDADRNNLYWGYDLHIWNANGDTINVESPNGEALFEHTYDGDDGDEDYTCDDFDTWEDAQEVYEESGGEYGLDDNGDGIACEGLSGAPDSEGDTASDGANGDSDDESNGSDDSEDPKAGDAEDSDDEDEETTDDSESGDNDTGNSDVETDEDDSNDGGESDNEGEETDDSSDSDVESDEDESADGDDNDEADANGGNESRRIRM